ncbi:hypothetical protein [Sporosarcina koreensis]|uniref:Uncharacterized protein n=1 Tax=Sporosarcina koreensis TaxID=334735 RepID=A0ABW0TW94_9BACL
MSSKKELIKIISALMYFLKPNPHFNIWITITLLGPLLNLFLTLFGKENQHPFFLNLISIVSVFIITWIWIKYAKEVKQFRHKNFPFWEELSLLKKQAKELSPVEIEQRFKTILERYET